MQELLCKTLVKSIIFLLDVVSRSLDSLCMVFFEVCLDNLDS